MTYHNVLFLQALCNTEVSGLHRILNNKIIGTPLAGKWWESQQQCHSVCCVKHLSCSTFLLLFFVWLCFSYHIHLNFHFYGLVISPDQVAELYIILLFLLMGTFKVMARNLD